MTENEIRETREIAQVLSADWCRKGKCTKNKCTADDCDCMTMAREIYNAGYRKIPDGAVVLTKDEYDGLVMGRPLIYRVQMPTEHFMKECKKDIENARKETAKELLEILKYEYEYNGYDLSYVYELYKEYGVEVDE